MQIQTAPQRLVSTQAPPPPQPPEDDGWDPFLDQVVSPVERRDRAIDEFCDVVATVFWGGMGAGLGAGAGLLASSGNPVAAAVGGVAGAAALGTLYQKGHADKMGKLMVSAGAIGLGAMVGAACGGTTGAVIGGGLGTAYAGWGLYTTWDD